MQVETVSMVVIAEVVVVQAVWVLLQPELPREMADHRHLRTRHGQPQLRRVRLGTTQAAVVVEHREVVRPEAVVVRVRVQVATGR
jgi:hypothetical protein